ncbi:hypothetical protein, partial [Pseudomonas aeruginosa]
RVARPRKNVNPPKDESEIISYNRRMAETSFSHFIRLIFPKQVFGMVHQELCEWMTLQDRKAHQLILMPRDHGKSRFAAFYALWELTRDPT